MKVLTILANLSLAVAVACPYGQLKKAGLLDRAGLAKYEELKRSGGHLEERSSNGLLSPITVAGLPLTLGGGLRKLSCFNIWNTTDHHQQLMVCCSRSLAVFHSLFHLRHNHSALRLSQVQILTISTLLLDRMTVVVSV